MNTINKIKFDFSQVPEIDRRLLGESLLPALKAHFANPENQRRFEERKKKHGIKE